MTTLPRDTRPAWANQGNAHGVPKACCSSRSPKVPGIEGVWGSGSRHPTRTGANPEGRRRTKQPGLRVVVPQRGSDKGSTERKGAKAYPKVTLKVGEGRDKKTRLSRRVFHGRCWTRTSDPIDVSDVLCQLS